MTDTALERAREAATPRPWETDEPIPTGAQVATGIREARDPERGIVGGPIRYADAAFIVALVNDYADGSLVHAALASGRLVEAGGETLEQRFPAEALARDFHDTYERLAPKFGYTTRAATAVAWEDVHGANRDLMVATAKEVLSRLATRAEAPAEGGALDALRQSLWLIGEDPSVPDRVRNGAHAVCAWLHTNRLAATQQPDTGGGDEE